MSVVNRSFFKPDYKNFYRQSENYQRRNGAQVKKTLRENHFTSATGLIFTLNPIMQNFFRLLIILMCY